ncbi:MAG: serine/threonine protein kinase [Planctomycetota bacterium]|nr:serine/threonine protein kinase [Planctomycetota bacterium]
MSFPPLEPPLFAVLPKMGGKPSLQLSQVTLESAILTTEIGSMFLGHHHGLNMPVMIRVMHPCARARLRDFDRFMFESRQLGQVRHTNIANVFDVGIFGDYAYLVFEYVAGIPLAERVLDRPYQESQALQLLLPVAEGLAEIWRRDLVHRSVSPRLIFVSSEGRPKLDFGTLRTGYNEPILKAAVAPYAAPYWSPEEVRGDEIFDPRSDMWSFGATLYHLVTGKPPFAAETPHDTAYGILHREPEDPRAARPGLHEAMRQLLLKLLRKNPNERYASPEQFLSALRSVEHRVTHDSTYVETVVMKEGSSPAGPFTRLHTKAGDQIGQCLLEKEVGSGAFGVVFRARHTVLDIPVAVKVLSHEVSQKDPAYVGMFLREARTAARIRHPNVIGIFEAGHQDGQYYLIMEFAPGGTVLDRMNLLGGRVPVTEGARIMLQAARGLAAAENLGIIHRDIKPENLMFGAGGGLKIADLGLAKRLLPAKGSIHDSLVADQLSMHKGSHDIVGTPPYMAPEIALSPDKVDTRADLYSLGCTAYHMLTGELPFDGKTSIEIIMKQVYEEAPAPEIFVPTIPRELSAIVRKLMAKKADERFQSGRDLEDALLKLAILQSERTPAAAD